MADTRKYDLLELTEKRKTAKNAYERDLIDSTMDRILRENGAVRKTRENLVQAVRNNDRRAVERFQHDLMMMRADETYGKDY